jgi:hypothetical protein
MTEEYENARLLLADLLWQIPLMKDEEGRDSVIAQVSRTLPGLTVAPSANGKLHCLNIVDAVLPMPGGLQRLASVLNWISEGAAQAGYFADKVAELLPSQFLTLAQWIDFVARMGKIVQEDELASYYQSVLSQADPDAFEISHFGSFGELARQLQELSRPHHENHLLVVLCEQIAHRKPAEAPVAREWADRIAGALDGSTRGGGLGSERNRLTTLRSSGAVSAAAKPARPTLIVQLDPSGQNHSQYLFSAWLYLDRKCGDKVYSSDDPMELEEARQALVKVLDKILILLIGNKKTSTNVEVEFILPRQLLFYAFDEWQLYGPDYMRLGYDFVTVVRDLDRMRTPRARAKLKEKWDRVSGENAQKVTDLSFWITCADREYQPGQRYLQLLSESIVSVGLTFHPNDGSHPFDLAEALNAGTPIVVWPRRCDHSKYPADKPVTGTFRDELVKRLRDHSLTDLRGIAREMRIDHGRSGVPGAGLTLLWDDPTLRPEPEDFSLGLPGPLEGNS